jgi:hypothetical protein
VIRPGLGAWSLQIRLFCRVGLPVCETRGWDLRDKRSGQGNRRERPRHHQLSGHGRTRRSPATPGSGLGDMGAGHPERERLRSPAQLQPGPGARAGGRLRCHVPMPIPGLGPSLLAGRSALVLVAVGERGVGVGKSGARSLYQQRSGALCVFAALCGALAIRGGCDTRASRLTAGGGSAAGERWSGRAARYRWGGRNAGDW